MLERVISFDPAAYSLETIQRAAYRYIDKFSIGFNVKEASIDCILQFDKEVDDLDGVIQDFRKEVLDQHLRARIAKETESIRHLILAHAFSRTGLV
ncbi:His-Xaa-Ser system protein HxsD [Methyloversatilis sp.]|uniref:His-Xaa-Ser system protein HxsD n=1 Tax=Methyloversatilis sp. TaxID=2569862 RepID=UPI001DE04686|nr:His-Xaa-Ser system protein HxsD [Methyloversatilis sp.]MBU1801798.1 His-Xaa-Ser system protein HxsD [Actinomycetota bacterium]MDP3456519.1 His-Xaa-Ser system protein HxsD [Methyloversatilis sp.]MDP3579738.1 His-Xaa-Ser system protein HxsD [Methyloversatilis sp.]MDP3874261.1 His-Xaa-Ser system protein HxsD [Methyloversatilis sp.]